MNSVLKEFILFDFRDGLTYGAQILRFCQYALYPVFVFSIIFDRLSKMPDPELILKRLLIAQFILIMLPTYYAPVTKFGTDVGDRILQQEKSGIIGNWLKIKHRAQRKLKEAPKDSSFWTTAKVFFNFDGMSAVDKGAALLIFGCLFAIKVIYSIVYYGMYMGSSILAVMSIFPRFEDHSFAIAKSVAYLIITAILIAFVLLFMNQVIDLQVSENGFIESIEGTAKFIVLCIILLACLAIGKSFVNGSGMENWAGTMGNMLSAGAAYKAMTMSATSLQKGSSYGQNFVSNSAKQIAPALMGSAGSVAYMASRPLATSYSTIKNNIKSNIAHKASKLNTHNPNLSNNSVNTNQPFIKGRYENAFSKVVSDKNAAKKPIRSALSPLTHMKASAVATKELGSAVYTKAKEKVGLPVNSKHLNIPQKATLMANHFINNKKITSPNEVKNQIVANRISRAIEVNNARKD